VICIAQMQIPCLIVFPAVADRPVRYSICLFLFIKNDSFPFGMGYVHTSIFSAKKFACSVVVFIWIQRNQKWQIGVLFYIIEKVRRLSVSIVLFQYDMCHGHANGCIHAGLNRQPCISKLVADSVIG